MKHLVIVLFFLGCISSQVNAQVDQGKIKLPAKVYSSELLVGSWVSESNEKYKIEKDEEGGYKVKAKNWDWLPLERSGQNLYKANSDDRTAFTVEILQENQLKIVKPSDSGEEITLIVYRKIDGEVLGKEDKSSESRKSVKDKRAFLLYYPSINSPFSFYGGFLNRKFNFYAGLSFSSATLSDGFENGTCEGEKYLTTEGKENADGLYTGDQMSSRATFSIGLTNEILSNRLRVHYGVGVGKYEEFRGFDIWNRDGGGEWNYVETEWAKDVSTVVEGVYLEAGLMYDLGVLVSLGFGTIQFEQHEVKLGIGHAF